jgi:hypothetical protein
MRYSIDIQFWLFVALTLTTVGILLFSVRIKGKGWLSAFLILSLLTSTGYYIPMLLNRTEVLSSNSYGKFMDVAGVVFSIFNMAGWVLLLVFVVSLKSVAGTNVAVVESGFAATGAPPESPYRGYNGWLAFFGGVQLFVQPVLAIIFLIIGGAAISDASSRYPGFVVIYCLEAVGNLGVVGLGMHAALRLRGIRRGAVRMTRIYLFAALGWSILAFVLPYLGDIPDSSREAMLLENLKGFVRTVIPFAIWFTYFGVSKRVKATYVD